MWFNDLISYFVFHQSAAASSAHDDCPVRSPQAQFLSVDHERFLERAFSLQPYPNKKQRQYLATEMHTTEEQVKLWFRKRRMTQKNHLSNEQQRSAKLAYLSSLAQRLAMHQNSRVPRVPASYHAVPYSQKRVSGPWPLYSRSTRVRPSPYIIPVNYVLPYYCK